MNAGKVRWFLRTRLTRTQYKVLGRTGELVARNNFITRVIPELKGYEGTLLTLVF